MIRARCVLCLVCILASGAGNATTSEPGALGVSTEFGAWLDESRDRQVPFKRYRPEKLDGPAPILIFSHGYGGSREAAAYLGKHMASHGYVSYHIQHPGSDSSIWEGSPNPLQTLAETPITPEMTLNRLADLPFAVDQITGENQSGELAGKLKLEALGMWGHSFGGVSTMAAAGQQFRGGSMPEPRIRAAAVFSPNAPGVVEPAVAYGGIVIPMLYVSGTNDVVAAFGQTVAHRRIAFEHSTNTIRYLLMANGANHSAWSGTRRREPVANQRARESVKAVGLAFWQAYLTDDVSARTWLRESAPSVVDGEFQIRDPAQKPMNANGE